MIGARPSDLTGCEGDLINQQVCKCERGTRRNKLKAASLLDISRRTLYRRLEEHGIRT